MFFFFSSRRRHTRCSRDWSSDVCSSDLGPHEVRGITHLGGTILGTSSRGDPLKWRVQRPDGSWEERDRSQELLDSFHAHRLDALIAIGGEGTLGIVHSLWKKGLPVVGVPKTIDNDVGGTSSTFRFDTAVATATDATDKAHPTPGDPDPRTGVRG